MAVAGSPGDLPMLVKQGQELKITSIPGYNWVPPEVTETCTTRELLTRLMNCSLALLMGHGHRDSHGVCHLSLDLG